MRVLVLGEDMEGKLEIRRTHEHEKIKPGDGTVDTIVYDNNRYDRRFIPGWGFSCVVTALENTILFDTGGDGEILLDNMKKLCTRPSEVDVIVLSHIHGDHTERLQEFPRHNSQVTVYLPDSFPTQIKQHIRSFGAEVKSVHEPEELFEGAITMGELNGAVDEQSLLVKVSEVFCLITGCAHPSIINITKKAKETVGKEVYLAM